MTRVWIFTAFIVGLLNGVSEAISLCTASGRFPNENVLNCRGYTMCLQGAPGDYTHLDLSCPENFVYSHIDNQCTNVTSYQCYPEYKCIKEGNFKDSADKNCTSYIACVRGLSQIATSRLVQCPENTLYSPSEGACVNSTVFTCDTDKIPSHGSSNTSINNTVNLYLKCVTLFYLIFSLAVYE